MGVTVTLPPLAGIVAEPAEPAVTVVTVPLTLFAACSTFIVPVADLLPLPLHVTVVDVIVFTVPVVVPRVLAVPAKLAGLAVIVSVPLVAAAVTADALAVEV